MKKDFLLLTDVPNMILLDEKTYALTYSESLTGELSLTCIIMQPIFVLKMNLQIYSLLIWLNLLLAYQQHYKVFLHDKISTPGLCALYF